MKCAPQSVTSIRAFLTPVAALFSSSMNRISTLQPAMPPAALISSIAMAAPISIWRP